VATTAIGLAQGDVGRQDHPSRRFRISSLPIPEMTGDDFILLAGRLAANPKAGEASFRSAVSRAEPDARAFK
jgi:hypothetical protein